MQTARVDIPGIDYDRLVAGGYRKTGIVAMIDALGISSADIRLAEKFIAESIRPT